MNSLILVFSLECHHLTCLEQKICSSWTKVTTIFSINPILMIGLSHNVASGNVITQFIIYKVMKYRKILINIVHILKGVVFHSCENAVKI